MSFLWKHRRRQLAWRIVGFLLAGGVSISLLATQVDPVTAAPDTFYLHPTVTTGITPAGEYMNNTAGTAGSTKTFNTAGQNAYWYADQTWPTGNNNASIAAGTYTLNMYFNQLPGAGWYSSSWQYRKQVTIDYTKVAAALTDFPVLISLASDTDLAADAQDDGDDILFTSSDGTTKLSHEIENFNGTTGALVAWVKVPSLSSTANTILYVYYGNATATNQQNPTGVWDANYRAVWRLKEDPSGTAPQMKDSTSNANHGTTNGAMTSGQQVAGQVDGSLSFDGSNDAVDAGSPASLDDLSVLTVSAWIKVNNLTGTSGNGITGKRDADATWGGWWFLVRRGTNRLEFESTWDSVGAWVTPNNSIATGTWYHVAFTYDGTSAANDPIFYINGASQSVTETVTPSGARRSDAVANFTIGANRNNAGVYFDFMDGIIDEARISSVIRPAGWIQTEYNNQSSPSTFYTLGGEATSPSVNITVTVSHTAADGTGATTIVQSSTTTINSSTANPLALSVGSDPTGQTFTSGNVRRLRVQVNVAGVNNNGSFTLAYDGSCASSLCSSLDTPVVTVPEYGLVLLPMALLLPVVASQLGSARRTSMAAILLSGSRTPVILSRSKRSFILSQSKRAIIRSQSRRAVILSVSKDDCEAASYRLRGETKPFGVIRGKGA